LIVSSYVDNFIKYSSFSKCHSEEKQPRIVRLGELHDLLGRSR
jgi:hypothetical protein